jgi:hypothetical protein
MSTARKLKLTHYLSLRRRLQGNPVKALTKRLLRLEARFGAMADAMQKSAVPSGAQVIAERLSALGIVREGNESLAETAARANGVEYGGVAGGPGAAGCWAAGLKYLPIFVDNAVFHRRCRA